MDREHDLIQHLMQRFTKPNKGFGIGDDCAVIPLNDSQAWVISTDALVENSHFQTDWISPEQLAHKSLLVNISDIAAMGGKPCFVLLTLALPQNYSNLWVDRFLTQLNTSLDHFKIQLIGGDTVAAEKLLINLTIIGTVDLNQIKYRHGGQSGDLLCVSKALGGSYAGLQCLLKNWQENDTTCAQQHLSPEIHLAQGQWLSQHSAVHAMMDVSDGLSCDLIKLCNASQLGADIHLEQLPLDADAAKLAKKYGVDPIDVAYGGGEDYALLCSIASNAFAQLNRDYQDHFKQSLWPIGVLSHDHRDVHLHLHGQPFQPKLQAFAHFA